LSYLLLLSFELKSFAIEGVAVSYV
jgi:hypothetical protein